MNIFESRENIIGTYDPAGTKSSIRDLFKLAKEIRIKLGKHDYLLDNYLSLVFDAANNTLAYEAAEKGFEAGSQHQGLCTDVLNSSESYKKHDFYQNVKQSFDNRRLNYHESFTHINLHSAYLADEYLEYATLSFIQEQSEMPGTLDTVEICELYRKITLLVDEKLMEQLNQKIKKRFFIVPVIAVFMQGLTDDLLYSLTHTDNETGKQIFQIIMDEL